jgi:hypothetical protein
VKNKIAPEYLAHARARWEVWTRGYSLLLDVNGKLYTYGLNKKPVPRKKEKEA